MSSSKPFYIMREGARWPVAPWVRSLTLRSRQALFSNNLNRPFPRRHLTKVSYTATWANEAARDGRL